MRWPVSVVAIGRRKSADRAYQQARLHAGQLRTAQPASWWGFCTLLSSFHLHQGTLRPVADLWSELLPFLLVRNEGLAARAVEEYLLYLEEPRRADKQWLGVVINEALAQVERLDDGVAVLLEHPASMFDARWMALLSYQTLLRVRRAVELHSTLSPALRQGAFWHGMPAHDPDVASYGGGGATWPPGRRGVAPRSRRVPDELAFSPSRLRRLRPMRPSALS